MKKFFKNIEYLTISIALFVLLVAFITFFFVRSKVYFSIMFSVLVLISFGMSAFLLLHKSETKEKMALTATYLLANLFIMCLDLVVIYKMWDLGVYSNLMYISNMKIYLGIYAVYVIAVALVAIYGMLKKLLQDKPNSTKHDN